MLWSWDWSHLKCWGIYVLLHILGNVLLIYLVSNVTLYGAIQVLRNAFLWRFDPHPPPRNANNVELYTFVMLFSVVVDTPTPHCIT